MADEAGNKPRKLRAGTFTINPGQPMEFRGVEVAGNHVPPSKLCTSIAQTLREYRKAARQLIEGKYATSRAHAPPHLRLPCHILVLCCPDGVIVRYDLAGDEEMKVRSADIPDQLREAAPIFSEQVFHFPDDPSTYIPEHQGPGYQWTIADEKGAVREVARLHPVIFASTEYPPDFQAPPPPARPTCLVSLHREFIMQMAGTLSSTDAPARSVAAPVDHFIARGIAPLAVGWQAIEIYPRLDESHWKPEFAPIWAELDLLTCVATANAEEASLMQLDGREGARNRYHQLLEELEGLLGGREEPAHQFLKAHPELISPTHDAMWSKHKFGSHVSDFVFREPPDDYVLVEIEAPHRKLFRKDGQPRAELTHAINQIDDWLVYVQDKGRSVDESLELPGIGSAPRCVVIIGRSADLSPENRRKLKVMESQRPRLAIQTYDDLLSRARTNLERLYGPLSMRGNGLKLYFFREGERTIPPLMD